MKLSFAQIGRLFEGFKLNNEEWWRRFRLVAYESWRHGSKNPPPINSYMPIGQEDSRELSEDEVKKLAENWQKYKKLDKKVKRKKLSKYVKART